MIRPFLITLVLLLSACTSPGAGDCPVSMDLIAPVMTDLHLIESIAIEIPIQVRDSMEQVYHDKVLQDHQLNRESFDSLIWIVRQEPAWIDSLYTRVGEALARIEAKKAQ